MANIKNVDGLEIGQDLKFQRRIWRLQRIGWIVMYLLILLAVLGLFGGGLFTRTTSGSREAGLQVEYPRFVRLQSPFTIQVLANSSAIEDDQVVLEIEKSYLQDLKIEDINPQPDRVVGSQDTLQYFFEVADESISPEIELTLNSDKIGLVKAHLAIRNGQDVRFNQFVFP